MSGSTPYFIIALAYASAALAAWLPDARAHPALGPEQASGASRAPLVRGLMVIAFVAQGFALSHALLGGEGLNIGFSHAISLIIWLVVAVSMLITLDSGFVVLATRVVGPIALAAALLPLVLPAQRIVHYVGLPARLHIVVAILGYALFTVASLQALLMLALERRLHAGNLPPALQGMPPLLRLERFLFRLLLVAFVLLTATVVSGVFFTEALFGRAFELNHKAVFAVLSWAIFGGLLFGHWRFGWRGRLAVRWTLFGFAALLLSYVGSKFVLEIILQRV
ncbi:MAG TPA: cytochrome c biogenesis protein CcsA [Usitatibacteraceae bacterium]|nr:cytochrome c biogenesis protein CcsA [Usitatibacteraceae bacterium]